MLTVLVAPDSFKGSATATAVAAALADGWAAARPDDRVLLLPQADGGEGTLDAVEQAVPGARRRDAGVVEGPDGRPVRGEWLELPGRIAVVELAQSCGLPLMRQPDPLGAHTVGLGQVMAAAIRSGARQLVVGLGGSASTDGGTGALTALGYAFLDRAGRRLAPGGAALAELDSIDGSDAMPMPEGGVTLLTDVDAPLLGPSGAAAVFSPQKGATPADVAVLDAALAVLASRMHGEPGRPGSGAAGGTGYGLATALGAGIESGSDRLAALSGLDRALDDADVLVTGEGRFDATSLTGKVVGRLLTKAAAVGARTIVIAGQVAAPPPSGAAPPVLVWSLSEIAGSAARAMSDPIPSLREAGRMAALAVR